MNPLEETVNRFIVKLDVQYTFDVDAKTYDEALEKAKYFQQTMPSGWGQGADVSWLDTNIVKEAIERDINV